MIIKDIVLFSKDCFALDNEKAQTIYFCTLDYS